MALTYAFPDPIYLANVGGSGTGLQPVVIDARDALTPGLPIPFQIVISATATVQILAGIELNHTTGAIVDPQDVSGGGFTTGNFYDIITTLPLYQVNITANSGTVKVKINDGALAPGQRGKIHIVTQTTNATQGL
jgi:hypothetical protein